MICRRCGNRVPEYLTTREYFQCPACGRQFGNPPAGDDRRGYEPRASRYERADDGYGRSTRFEPEYDGGYARRSTRFEPEYDDSPADDSYYDDGQGYYDDGDGYYDDRSYDDGYYDDRYYDDPQDYADDYADYGEPAPRRAQKQPRAPKPKGPKRTMKLVVLLYVLIVEVVFLIVVACIGAGMNPGEPAKSDPTAAPAVVETTATRDPNATVNPYPVV